MTVGGECFIRNNLKTLTVNVPSKHQTGRAAILVHEQIDWQGVCTHVYLPRLHPRATLIRPVTPLIAINVDSATIIRSQPELNRLMLRDRDEPCHVNHKQVIRAILIWLTVVTSIDVVLNLRTTQQILTVRHHRRNNINRVIRREQPRYRIS